MLANRIRKFSSYYATIGRLALPLFIGQLGNIAVSFADNIMVGHYSTDALASASFVNNLFNIAIFACMGFTYGLTPLMGALFARGEKESIGHLTRIGLRINTLFTLLVVGLMFALYLNIERMGQPEQLLPLIKPYYLQRVEPVELCCGKYCNADVDSSVGKCIQCGVQLYLHIRQIRYAGAWSYRGRLQHLCRQNTVCPVDSCDFLCHAYGP